MAIRVATGDIVFVWDLGSSDSDQDDHYARILIIRIMEPDNIRVRVDYQTRPAARNL